MGVACAATRYGERSLAASLGSGQDDADDEAGDAADEEAEGDLRERRQEVGRHRALEPGAHEPLSDEGRPGKDERRVVADPDDQLPHGDEGECAARATEQVGQPAPPDRVSARTPSVPAWLTTVADGWRARGGLRARRRSPVSSAALDRRRAAENAPRSIRQTTRPGTSTRMSAMTRPGLAERTTTRSASRTASGMLWVTTTSVIAPRCHRAWSSRSRRSRV